MLPADESIGAKEAVVLAPSVGSKNEVSTAGPATPQIDEHREQQVSEIILAPLLEDAAEAEDPKLTQNQVQRSVNEEVSIQNMAELAPTEPDQPNSVQPQQQVEVVALNAEAPRLEDVEEVSVRAPSTAVSSQPVTSVQIPPAEQVARAITLEELHDISGVSARYAGLLKGWLRENMHYPRAARIAGQEGRAIVRFVIDRSGKVSSIRLEQSSGHAILDREAVEMIERADPFPIMPDEMAGSQLELRVPIVFDINQESLIRQIPPIFLE